MFMQENKVSGSFIIAHFRSTNRERWFICIIFIVQNWKRKPSRKLNLWQPYSPN